MTALLRFDQVALRRGGRLLFDQMDLTLNAGDTLSIGGPNGSGKSSLIRLAAGLLEAERGRVAASPLALADDHLALDAELPLERALRLWCASPAAAIDALGLADLAQVPIRYLSAGQRKRAALARVAASGKPLWLLDEPLNALDSDGAERLGRIIARHRSDGGAVLAASHTPLPGEWRKLELGR